MLSAKALFNDLGSKWPLFIVAFTLGGGIVTHDPQYWSKLVTTVPP